MFILVLFHLINHGEATILFVLFIIITFSYSSNLSNVEIIKTLFIFCVALRLMLSKSNIKQHKFIEICFVNKCFK